MSFIEKRRQFFTKISNFWPDLYGEEYALYDLYLTDQNEINKIKKATKRIGGIYFKTAEILRHTEDEILLELGFPLESLTFLRLKTITQESVISRLDLVKSNGTYKCLELNSDTPTFIKELYEVNNWICKEFHVEDPNKGLKKNLSNALRKQIIDSLNWIQAEDPNVVFTSHDDHLEDLNTVLYLQQITKIPSHFVPLNKLQIVKGEGLFDEQGKKIHVLCRPTFPIENLLLDQDAKGNKIGQWLLELVNLKKLAIINPPSAFLLQNKAVQAIIWNLHEEDHPFFTLEEHEWIEEHFLPTYLEPDSFYKESVPFVKKPIFGREGDTVEIFDEKGKLRLEDSQKSYSQYPSIYQKYLELPKVQINTIKGVTTGHMIVGSFYINGAPGAIGYRVGEEITNNLSYYLPIGIK